MQNAVARFYLFDDPPDQDADAEFIDRAHVGDRDAAITDELLFKRIDRPGSEQIELVGINGDAGLVAQEVVESGFAAEKGGRHPVHVAGHRRRRRVVVGVSVEPQHEKRPA